MSKKFIISSLIVLFLGLILVSATDLTQLSISPSPISLFGLPGDTKSLSVQITNNVGSSLILSISKADLIGMNDPSKRILSSQVNVNPATFTLPDGQTQQVVVSLTIPTGIPADTYKGTFTVGDGVDSKNFDVLVVIQPQANFNILTYTDSSPLTLTGQGDSTLNGSFSIQNTGSIPLNFDSSSFGTSGLDLSDGTRTIGLTFPTFTVNPGDTQSVNIAAQVPNRMDINTYGGKLNVTNNGVKKSFEFDIKINPQVCKNGPVGDLTLSVDNPSSGDTFNPGETINVKANIANDFDRNLNNIRLKAFLYDVDSNSKVVEGQSDTSAIDKNSDKDFKLDLEIPIDVKASDTFILFVKAFQDGSESKHCGEDQVDVTVERQDHDVIVASNGVSVLPTQTVKQGESFDVDVRVVNTGSSDENDVTVKLDVPELRISETSERFNLKSGESSDNDRIVHFTDLKVPADAKVKRGYSVEATVNFDSSSRTNSGFGTLDVIEGTVAPPPQPTNVLKIQSTTETTPGNYAVTAILTNSGSDDTIYTVEGSASWANLVSPQIVSIKSGESKPIQFNFVARDGLEAGSYSGSLVIKDVKGTIIDSESFTVTVAGKSTNNQPSGGVTGLTIFQGISGSTVLFVIGDVVLVVIAIFFIRLIFTSGKKKGGMMPPSRVEKVKL